MSISSDGKHLGYIPYTKRKTPQWLMLRFFGFKILVTRPHLWIYGCYCKDIAITLLVAKNENAYVYFLFPFFDPQKLYKMNQIYLNLDCKDVKKIRRSRLRNLFFRFIWVVFEQFGRILRKFGKSVDSNYSGPYLRRFLLTEKIELIWPKRKIAKARKEALKIGIRENDKVVCINVRENGWTDNPDRPAAIQTYRRENRIEPHMSSTVENYQKTINWLALQGYKIVRIGDSFMRPVSLPNLIDLATRPGDNHLLEAYLLKISEFFISTDSGGSAAHHLANVPMLRTNTINPIMCLPIKKNVWYMLKTPVKIVTGEKLSLEGSLTTSFHTHYPPKGYRFEENSPEEILQGVKEFIDYLNGKRTPTLEQFAWAKRVCSAAKKFRNINGTLKKHGIDGDFIGHGLLAPHQAEKLIL